VKGFRPQHGAIALASLLVAQGATAGDAGGGGLVGWVETSQGVPVAGAVVSLFGKGIRGGSLVTLTDSAGQFAMPSLPAGSYTLRAISNGHEPAAARQVTVLPNQESLFTVSLTPEGEAAVAATPEADPGTTGVAPREWRWLVRHRRRSVLDSEDGSAPAGPTEVVTSNLPSPVTPLAVADLIGSVEFVSAPLVLDDSAASPLDSAANLGAVRLRGHFAGGGSWSLGGLMAETGATTWRMAAEFLIDPAEGHQLEAGAGFGTRDLQLGVTEAQPLGIDVRSLGALFVRDTWAVDENFTASAGARYTFVGFVRDHHYVDPYAAIAIRSGRNTQLRGSVGTRTLAPGGDLLTLSTIASSPVLAMARLADDARVERVLRTEVTIDRNLGKTTTIGALAFNEGVRDQLVSEYGADPGTRAFRIGNAGAVGVRGVGLTVSQRLGTALVGTVTYTAGQTRYDGSPAGDAWSQFPVFAHAADFRDLVARLETLIDATDTRLTAYCRWNTLIPEYDGVETVAAVHNTRFDVQLTQGLPFLRDLTRADWEVLLSVRNLSYENAEAGSFDELVVLRPPKRVMGGVAVRF
jgi:hypothetical protein